MRPLTDYIVQKVYDDIRTPTPGRCPLIVFGTKSGLKDRGRGVFHCPQCNADRPYVHVEVVRKGTLYFVPLVDMGSVGEYIQCLHCDGQFDVAVLTLPTRASLEEKLNEAIRGAMAMMIRADAVIDGEEMHAARYVFKRITGADLSAAGQIRDIETFDPENLGGALSLLADRLTDQGKVQILEACVIVAAADDVIEPSEFAVIKGIAEVLGVPAEYVPGIVSTVALQDRDEAPQDEATQGDGSRSIPADPDPETGYLVVLLDAGPRFFTVALALHGLSGVKGRDAINMVASPPVIVVDEVSLEAAESVVAGLQGLGAIASVEPRERYLARRAEQTE